MIHMVPRLSRIWLGRGDIADISTYNVESTPPAPPAPAPPPAMSGIPKLLEKMAIENQVSKFTAPNLCSFWVFWGRIC